MLLKKKKKVEVTKDETEGFFQTEGDKKLNMIIYPGTGS